MRRVTVISKAGCHLCEKVEDAVRRLSDRRDIEVTVLLIDDDPSLHDRYWLTVPVVRVDGRDVFDARQMSLGDYEGKLELLLR
jgi:glutaredoxin